MYQMAGEPESSGSVHQAALFTGMMVLLLQDFLI
jgi:hypothetical protein